MLVVLVLIAVSVVAVLKWLPEALASGALKGKAKAEDVGRVRTAILATLAGFLAAIGAYYTHRTWQLNRATLEHNREAAERSYALDQARLITERFTRAIDQLGNSSLDVRLGGIYALERIARDSGDDHPQVVEVLTAYVREHASWPPRSAPENSREPPQLATDVQAVMTVLGRRDASRDRDLGFARTAPALELARTDLRRVQLAWADLRRANLSGTHLEGAELFQVDLREAWLDGAHLEGAQLAGTEFDGVQLVGANLRGAKLASAYQLASADMNGALYDDYTTWPAGFDYRAAGARPVDEQTNASVPPPD